MPRSLKPKAGAGAAIAHGILVVALIFSTLPVAAQAQGQGQGREHSQRGRQEGQRQSQGPQRHEVQRQRTERNRYEWRRGHYEVVHPPAAALRTLPPGHVTTRLGDHRYYEHGGHYYVERSGSFVLVAPPIGVVLTTLPAGAISLRIGGVGYFLAGGVYYRHSPQGYVVVTAPQPVPGVVTTGVQQVVVQAAILNVRSGPGLEFSVVSRAQQGVALAVFGDAPGWYYVRLPDGMYGWVMAQYTIPVQAVPAG